MAVTSDTGLLTVFKEWYTDKEMESVLWRASPVLREIKKNRVGGKSYNFAANYGSGGACAGDATVAASNAASGTSKSAQFAVTPGQLFSIFNVGAQEVLASENIRGAFVPVPVVKMYDGTAAFRRLFATALYGMGFGEIGQVGANAGLVTQGASNTIDFVQFSTVVKLDIGSQFIVTNGATPGSSLRTLVCTVTAINGTSVTFTAASGSNETWAATDWICIYGCRASSTPLLPVGLAGWLPTVAGRSGGTWTTYIGTSFYGVDRSVFPDRLAGNYIARDTGGSEKYVDCIVRAVKAVRNAGGNPQWLVINPDDYAKVISEVNGQTTYFQQTDMGKAKGKTNEALRGLSDMKYMFSTSWVDKVYDDPFCPRLTAYIIDEETIEFAMLTNGDTPVNDGIVANNPGVQPVNGVSTPDMKNTYAFIFDDYVTIQPGSLASSGPVLQVILQLYGSFALRAPGKNAVINFVS